MRSMKWLGILALCLLLPAASAFALATISGKVMNDDGEPIAGANVMVKNTSFGAATDLDGRYTIVFPLDGSYTVMASALNYATAMKDVRIDPDGSVSVNFTLEADVLSLGTVVVTGVRNPQEKIESAVAITTASSEQIEEQAPRNTADLLKVVPGFYVESSGGEGGNNLFVRGIPADGSFRYVAMYEDGLPVFESPELAFANIDLLMRVDDTIDRMEALRGGTAAIYASNAPGGMINFLSKTGSGAPGGMVKFSVGDYGLFRTDFNYGGSMGEKWRYNVGGFFRQDDGVRNPDFIANQGGQLKANVTRLLDGGFLRFYGKYLNDRNIFYLPIPLTNPDDPEGLDGFDPNFGTMTTSSARFLRARRPNGIGALELNLQDGMHPVISSFGAEFDQELGSGWTINNKARYTDIDLTFNAIFSLDNPFLAEDFAADKIAEWNSLHPNDPVSADAWEYRYARGTALTQNQVDNLNGNGLVARTGWWYVDKPMHNFVNKLELSHSAEFGGTHNYTFGHYYSTYSADDYWYWQNILSEVADAPRLMDLRLTTDAGNTVFVTGGGVERFGSFYRNAESNSVVNAVYFTDEYEATEALRLDFGLRYENARMYGTVEGLSEYDLDGGGADFTMYNDNATYGSNRYFLYDYTFDEVGYTLGANFTLRPNTLATYARFSSGFRMPDFDQWAGGAVTSSGEVENIIQAEGGVKYSSPKLAAAASVFYSSFDNVPFTDEVIQGGNIVQLTRFANSRTIGAEFEVVSRPVKHLDLSLIATVQQPQYVDYTFDQRDPATGQVIESYDFDGNQVRRIPQVFLSFTPSYEVMANMRVAASVRYFSTRYVDDANEVELPGFTTINAYASYRFSDFKVGVYGNNLTNTIGLTEGNPRVQQAVAEEAQFYMARPVLGRSFKASLTYFFN